MPTTQRDAAVIGVSIDVVARYPRYGSWRLFDRMRVEGVDGTHKDVHRVCCALQLNLLRRGLLQTLLLVDRRARVALAQGAADEPVPRCNIAPAA